MSDRAVWASYENFEGWLYRGQTKFSLPKNPSFNDWLLATLTATEGGSYGSVNGYDSCGVSCSIIQVCEFGLYGVCDLLGFMVSHGVFDPNAPGRYKDAMGMSGASFGKTIKGSWRFTMPAPFHSVDTKTEQQIHFFGGANVGEKGTWTDSTKQHALAWVTALGQTFDDPKTLEVQNTFNALRLRSSYDHPFFVGKDDEGYLGAVHAAYCSFSANRPTTAKEAFNRFLSGPAKQMTEGSQAWAEEALRELTFAGIAIWPHRYDCIRPVLEKAFGIDLPDMHDELRSRGATSVSPTTIQKWLITVGFDLGPSGADGAFGPKSKAALLTFQQLNKVTPTGVPDAATCVLLSEAAKKAGEEEAAQSSANPA